MCDPVTMGLAASAIGGGSFLQGKARSDASNAIEDISREEAGRQTQLSDTAFGNISDAAGAFEKATFAEEMAKQGDTLESSLKAAQTDLSKVNPSTGVPGSAPKIVTDFETKERGESRDFTDALAESRARLKSFGNAMVPAGIGVGRSAQSNIPIASFMRGSAEASRSEIEDARRKAQSPIGDILVGLGGMGLSHNLYGGRGIGDIFTMDPTIHGLATGGLRA